MNLRRHTSIAILIIVLLTVFLSISCEEILKLNITGDGNIITDTLRWRNNYTIRDIQLADDFILEIYQSEKPALHIEADSNLLSYIKTDFLRNTLTIRRQSDHFLKPSKNITIRLFINNLSVIDVWNKGTVVCDTLTATTLHVNTYRKSNFSCKYAEVENLFFRAEGSTKVDINGNFIYLDYSQIGSGESFLNGNVETLKLLQEGSGKIEAFDLEANVAFISLIHSGLIYCYVSNFLTVDLKGTGRVYYKGNPETEISIEGSGGVYSGSL